MLQYLHLSHYSTETLLLMALVIAGAGFVVGYITDVVMRDRGFGPVGNGLLAVLGAFTGIFIRNAYFGRMDPGDLFTTGFFAVVAATLLLLILGVAKHFVQD